MHQFSSHNNTHTHMHIRRHTHTNTKFIACICHSTHSLSYQFMQIFPKGVIFLNIFSIQNSNFTTRTIAQAHTHAWHTMKNKQHHLCEFLIKNEMSAFLIIFLSQRMTRISILAIKICSFSIKKKITCFATLKYVQVSKSWVFRRQTLENVNFFTFFYRNAFGKGQSCFCTSRLVMYAKKKTLIHIITTTTTSTTCRLCGLLKLEINEWCIWE